MIELRKHRTLDIIDSPDNRRIVSVSDRQRFKEPDMIEKDFKSPYKQTIGKIGIQPPPPVKDFPGGAGLPSPEIDSGKIKITASEVKKVADVSATKTFVSFCPKINQFGKEWESFKDGLFSFFQSYTNGSVKKTFKDSPYFVMQRALDFTDVQSKVMAYIKTFKANLPDTDSGDNMAKALNTVSFEVGSSPAGRQVLFTFDRTQSAKEVINQSKVKSENTEIILYGALALGLIFLIK